MPSSPCNGVCQVESGVCISCNRTLEDIARWQSMTEEERLQRMKELAQDDDME